MLILTVAYALLVVEYIAELGLLGFKNLCAKKIAQVLTVHTLVIFNYK